VDFGLHLIDDLQSLARLEVREIAVEPLTKRRISSPLEHLLAESATREQRGDVEDCVLGAAAEPRILGAQRLVGLEEREHGKAERILHARAR
jgi:hypothetical protein